MHALMIKFMYQTLIAHWKENNTDVASQEMAATSHLSNLPPSVSLPVSILNNHFFLEQTVFAKRRPYSQLLEPLDWTRSVPDWTGTGNSRINS